MQELHFALVGNPNCGKTALFNRITGARAKVANYAGVTVEKRMGPIASMGPDVHLIDLPGTYSLHVTSPDEAVARRVILGEMAGEVAPDVLVAVVDSTHLKLGLRLVMELRALGRPMILALNMADEARARGIVIDTARLAARLDMPVVETVAIRSRGSDTLLAAMTDLAGRVVPGAAVAGSLVREESIEALYARIDDILAECVTQPDDMPEWQHRLDAVFMHPVIGLIILVSVLLAMFQAVFAWASPLVDLIDGGVQACGAALSEWLPDGVLKAFLVDGLVAGLGSVLVFLPQILILFAFILLLEDSGYLPRAAFLLDRLMRGVGLSGRAFIPMLSSFACAVPGIMATRTIQDPRERLITIMVAPLMTCSARLPVYALVIAAFIPAQTVWGVFNLQGLTLFALYVAGILSAALVALVLRGIRSRKEDFPLLMELPSYRWPSAYHFFIGLRERAWIFLRRVGTIILALSVLLWFMSSYPKPPDGAELPAIEYSLAGLLGHFMQPVFEPLGFNWQMCIALIPAMAAREVAVAALATVYAVAGAEDAAPSLVPLLAGDWSLPVALAYLAWFVYAPQCISTIATVRQETNSRAATTAFVVYLFGLAWLAAFATYRIALAMTGG